MSERQAEALCKARVAVDAFVEDARAGYPVDILVPNLRDCALALTQITGARRKARARLRGDDYVDDEEDEEELEEAVLNRLFARFCVGK